MEEVRLHEEVVWGDRLRVIIKKSPPLQLFNVPPKAWMNWRQNLLNVYDSSICYSEAKVFNKKLEEQSGLRFVLGWATLCCSMQRGKEKSSSLQVEVRALINDLKINSPFNAHRIIFQTRMVSECIAKATSEDRKTLPWFLILLHNRLHRREQLNRNPPLASWGNLRIERFFNEERSISSMSNDEMLF